MNYRNLGSTGLKVSVVGLGCGGPSRLGQRDGKSPDHSVNLVRKALDLGVNLLDTAETYGTEEIVGAALRDVPRDRVVLSAKKTLPEPDDPDPAGTIRSGLDACLKRLGTDYVDIYHLHGVGDARYDFAADVLAPVVTGLKEAGKIRAVGITEEFPANPRHRRRCLERGLHDPWWDVVMVGFNLLNPSARRSVFPLTLEKGVGTLVMFAVRRALSQPAHAAQSHEAAVVREMEQRALVEPGADLGWSGRGRFLTDNGCAETGLGELHRGGVPFLRARAGGRRGADGDRGRETPGGQYRRCAQAAAPALEALEKLEALFGKVDSVTGN